MTGDVYAVPVKTKNLVAVLAKRVDDEPSLLQMMASILSNAGLEIRTSATVAEATAALAEWYPDVVVIDVHIEGGPAGIQLAETKDGGKDDEQQE